MTQRLLSPGVKVCGMIPLTFWHRIGQVPRYARLVANADGPLSARIVDAYEIDGDDASSATDRMGRAATASLSWTSLARGRQRPRSIAS